MTLQPPGRAGLQAEVGNCRQGAQLLVDKSAQLADGHLTGRVTPERKAWGHQPVPPSRPVEVSGMLAGPQTWAQPTQSSSGHPRYPEGLVHSSVALAGSNPHSLPRNRSACSASRTLCSDFSLGSSCGPRKLQPQMSPHWIIQDVVLRTFMASSATRLGPCSLAPTSKAISASTLNCLTLCLSGCQALAHLFPDTQPQLAGSFLPPRKHHLPATLLVGDSWRVAWVLSTPRISAVCRHPPASHLALGKAHGQGQCWKSCQDAEEGLHLKGSTGPGGWALQGYGVWLQRWKKFPEGLVYLKTERPPACIIVSSVSRGNPTQSGEVLRRVG